MAAALGMMDSPEPTPRERVCPPTPFKRRCIRGPNSSQHIDLIRSTLSDLGTDEKEEALMHLSPRMLEALLAAYFLWRVNTSHEAFNLLLDVVPDLTEQVQVLVSQAYPDMAADDWDDFAAMAVNNTEVCTHLIEQLTDLLPVHGATRSLQF